MAEREPEKTPRQSAVEMTEMVLPNDTNIFGTIFGGRLMQWIDIAAAIVSARHSGQHAVTASIDQISFLAPVKAGQVVNLKASMNYVGHSSMEVGVRVESEDVVTGERRHISTAYLTYVAKDESGQRVRVPRLALETEEDRRRHGDAQERTSRRKSWTKHRGPSTP